MRKYIFFLCCSFVFESAYANNISIKKVAIVDTNRIAKTASIRFNISWENSWRDDVNWDAAWIFIKYRLPKDSVWQYKHLTVSTSNNETGQGNTMMKFAIPEDRKGLFYYRQTNGAGNIKMDSVKLFWNYGADNVNEIDSVEVKVFATEMVYVPDGNYCLGDGNGKLRSSYSFQLKNAPNNFVTITNNWSPLINTFQCLTCGGNDDAILTNAGIRISGLNGIDVTGDKVAEYPDFPTGYRAFYVMKYPVTQGQYADFLNTLSLRDSIFPPYTYQTDTTKLKKVNPKYKLALQNLDPFYYNIPIDIQRHTILLDTSEGKYTVSRPDRAFGKATTFYYESFTDWASMRMLTELEYEKAARGPLPPMYKSYSNSYFGNNDTTLNWSGFDWAWGNDSMIARTNSYGNSTLNYSGTENGTEFFSNYSVYNRYINPAQSNMVMGTSTTGGDGGVGPYRVGIFANDTSSRVSSGATYYGIMDFSKNVAQMTVSIGNKTARTVSYKKNGDGLLNALGGSDIGEFYTPDNNMGPAMMGGTYIFKQNEVSGRNNYGNYIGFRSVRSAPSDN